MSNFVPYKTLRKDGKVLIEFEAPLIDARALQPELQNALAAYQQIELDVSYSMPAFAPAQKQSGNVVAVPAALPAEPLQPQPSSTPALAQQVDGSDSISSSQPTQESTFLLRNLRPNATRVPENSGLIVDVVSEVSSKPYTKGRKKRRSDTVMLADASGERMLGIDFTTENAEHSPQLRFGARLDVSGAEIKPIDAKFVRNGFSRQIWLGDPAVVILRHMGAAGQQVTQTAQSSSTGTERKKRKQESDDDDDGAV